MPQFPKSDRIQIESRRSENQPKLQGADLEAHQQLAETEAPVLDPETGKPLGPITRYELSHTGVINLEDEDEHQNMRITDHPTPNHPTGRLGI